MKRLVVLFVVLFVLFLPLMTLIAERDIRSSMEQPIVGVRKIVSEASGTVTANAVKPAESKAPEPPLSAQECIAILNEDYKRIWESEQAKKAQTEMLSVRYALTDEERAAVEQMIASEGGYCSYEFQALVATCMLNGCEQDGLRPLEIFARGDYWLTHDVEPTETTKQAVSDVFDRGILPTDEPIRAYYNPNYCTSNWHESLCYVLTCCDCRFFKYWG